VSLSQSLVVKSIARLKPEIFDQVSCHEIGHLHQSRISTEISGAGHFLRAILGLIDIDEPKMQNTIPTEMDADLFAWRTAKQVLGDEVDGYVMAEAEVGKRKDSFRLLLEHGLAQPYDVVAKTYNLMSKYRESLALKLSELEDSDHLRNFDIDQMLQSLTEIKHEGAEQ